MDRRREPRSNFNSPIKYRVMYSDTYKEGILVNMGENGALLWLPEEYPVGTSVDVMIGSHENPEHVNMRVVRPEETSHEGYNGYGLKVEMTLSEAA